MKDKKQEVDVDTSATGGVDRRRFSGAFHTLLHRALTNWGHCYDINSGVISVPINDWDRAQHPVLGAATEFEVDISAFRLVGTKQNIPSGMLNHDKKDKGKKGKKDGGDA